VALARPLADYASVATWADGLRQQWGGDPLAEDPEKGATLQAFCELVGKDPDELVAFCFLRRKATGERFTSKLRREEMTKRLGEFVTASRLRGVEARRRRNVVVSFLSHNGVLM
jgi:hypothetical protein